MTEAQQIAEDGLKFQEDVLGQPTVVYRGRHFPCLYSTIRRGQFVTFGGKEETIQLSCKRRISARSVRTADANEGWTADSDDAPLADEDLLPPTPGKRVMVRQKYFRIISVDVDSAGAAWIVNLGSVRK